jgi:hypothetical protein
MHAAEGDAKNIVSNLVRSAVAKASARGVVLGQAQYTTDAGLITVAAMWHEDDLKVTWTLSPNPRGSKPQTIDAAKARPLVAVTIYRLCERNA